MDIKAVFFDIDGTIVPFGNNIVPDDVVEAVKTLRAKGIKVFIATGRHISWIDNLGAMEVDGYVTVNGAMCQLADKKTAIFTRAIAHDDICRLIDAYPGLPLEFCLVPTDGDIFISNVNHYVTDVCRIIKVPPIPVKPLESIGNKDVVQLMAFGDKADWSAPGLYSDILKDCTPTSWNPFFCDIIPSDIDKNIGVGKMLEYFGISPDRSMSFGDGNNDIPMIKCCAVGVAMGNASPEVKEAADYITTEAADGGVVAALKHFKLL